VKEEDYHRVAHTVENVMGDENVYLDVFVEEMRYSDTPGDLVRVGSYCRYTIKT